MGTGRLPTWPGQRRRRDPRLRGGGHGQKTRAGDTLRGRFGLQTEQVPACSSIRSRRAGVVVPVQPLSSAARSGQAWLFQFESLNRIEPQAEPFIAN